MNFYIQELKRRFPKSPCIKPNMAKKVIPTNTQFAYAWQILRAIKSVKRGS
jgi:hypothetical protein